jgi:hypothetical protein
MNYLKAALAGFGMSFIGTALCGAKVGTYYECRARKFKNDMDKNLLLKDYVINSNALPEYKFWWPKNFYNGLIEKEWSVATSLTINNAICIPTALLGALFHDKVGRDLTPKINSYFDSEISPYLVTGGLFGILGTVVEVIDVLSTSEYFRNDPTQPWIYTTPIIQGFVIGATAMAGAYFGDEKSLDNAIELESEDDIDII